MVKNNLRRNLKTRIFAIALVGAVIFGTIVSSIPSYASEITSTEATNTEEASTEVTTNTETTDEGEKSNPNATPDDVTPVDIVLHIEVAPKVKTGTVYITSKNSGTEYSAEIVNGQVGIPLIPGTYSVTRIVDSNGNPVKDITENTIVASNKMFSSSQYSITNAKADDPTYKFVQSQIDFFFNHIITLIIVLVLAFALYRIQKNKETVGKKD